MSSLLCGLLLAAIPALAAAQTLSGTVTNGTTNRPAAGDEVVLIKLAQGMDEVAHTTADGKGHFSFKLDDPGSPHLLRAIHQGVAYHQMAPPGVAAIEMQVYDVAKKLQDLSVTADVLRLQAESGSLQVVRRFAINNSSSPPRTQMNDRNFEFYLPEGAQLDSGMAKTANGQPVNSAPVPQKEKGRYAFIFPLRPGQTEFQVAFHMPYSGSATLDPKSLYPSQHLVVVLPKSMTFSAVSGSSFQSVQDRGKSDTQVEVVTSTQVGQPLSFKVSGTGTLPPSESSGSSGQSGSGMAVNSSQSGNGSGPPTQTPGVTGSYRWYILGGFVALLIGMVFYVIRRPGKAAAGAAESAPSTSGDVAVQSNPPAAAGTSNLLFQALKEEMFELEIEHKQGLISAEEYGKAKAALDQTLERAIKREAKS
jgi:hypothetical protein